MNELVKIIPQGWQYPEICRASITVGQEKYGRDDLPHRGEAIHSDIRIQETLAGKISVYYIEDAAFLLEETKLLNAIP